VIRFNLLSLFLILSSIAWADGYAEIQNLLAKHGFRGGLYSSFSDQITPAEYNTALDSLKKVLAETLALRDFSKVANIDVTRSRQSVDVDASGKISMNLSIGEAPESWIALLSSDLARETFYRNFVVQSAVKRNASLTKEFGAIYPVHAAAEKWMCSGEKLDQFDLQISTINLNGCMYFHRGDISSGNYDETLNCSLEKSPAGQLIWSRAYQGHRLTTQKFKINAPGSRLRPTALASADYDEKCNYRGGQAWSYGAFGTLPVRRHFLNDRGLVDQTVYLKRDVFSLKQIYPAMMSSGMLSLADAERISAQKNRVLISILDQGVDYNHPDLAFRMLRNLDGSIEGHDYETNDNEPYDYFSGYEEEQYRVFNHGTHVAGIAARGNNRIAILPLRLVNTNGDIRHQQAIDYAASLGSKIVNVSQGTYDRKDWTYLISSIEKHPEILFVVAAGNDGKNLDGFAEYPAVLSFPNMIVVASVNKKQNGLASDSNWSEKYVNIAAPGEEILSDTPENSYGPKTGTSMATPAVSNIAAKMLLANSKLTPVQIIQILETSATPLTSLKGKVSSGGVLNEEAAVARASSFFP